MAKGISIGRLTDVSKSASGLNISKDAKALMKNVVEEWIRLSTRRMEQVTLDAFPDAKTILDPANPQLSLNRVRGIMGEVTELNQSAAAAITIKSEAESLIREITRDAAGIAISEDMRTIKAGHIQTVLDTSKISAEPEGVSSIETNVGMNIGRDIFMGDRELKHIISQYTRKRVSPEAVEELRTFLEEETSERLFRLEESIDENRFPEIRDLVQSVQKLIDQNRIKAIVATADELAEERGKKTIGVEEICDGFSRFS